MSIWEEKESYAYALKKTRTNNYYNLPLSSLSNKIQQDIQTNKKNKNYPYEPHIQDHYNLCPPINKITIKPKLTCHPTVVSESTEG